MDPKKALEEWHAANNKSDTLNANVGSDGTNETYDKNQGNRGKQKNPTWQTKQQKPGAPYEGDKDLDEGDVFGPVG